MIYVSIASAVFSMENQKNMWYRHVVSFNIQNFICVVNKYANESMYETIIDSNSECGESVIMRSDSFFECE